MNVIFKRWSSMRRGVLLVGMLIFAALPGAARASSLHASFGAAAFPQRSLLVTVRGAPTLTPQRIHITENGVPTPVESVSSLRGAGHGDFGVMLLIDTDPSMSGAPLNQAVLAARELASQRSGNQLIGVMYGDRVTLPLTADPAAIQGALAAPPASLSHTDLLRDATTAISRLTAARVAAGAVIYVSDDVDRDPAYSPQSVGTFAASSHVRLFVVGIRDAAFFHRLPNDLPSASMQTLAAAGGGDYVAARPGELGQIFSSIESGLRSNYLIRYRSTQLRGQSVFVSVRVNGIPDEVALNYATPRLAQLRVARTVHHQAFWASGAAVALAGLIGALLIGLLAWFVFGRYSSSDLLQSRVGDYAEASPKSEIVLPTFDEPAPLSGPLAASGWWSRFSGDVEIARMGMSPARFVEIAALIAFTAAVLLTLLSGTALVAVLLLLAAPFVARAFVNGRVRRQRNLFSQQLPAHLEEAAGAIRSGRSLVEALRVVAEGAEEPTRSEFERALADEQLGQPLDEVLRPIGQRMGSPDIEQLAVIAALNRGSGANVAEVLDHVAEGARQRDEMRRELSVMTAQARLTRWILTALPLGMLLLLSLLRPEYERPMFHTSSGRVMLALGAGLVALGTFVMSRIVDIEA